MTPTVTYLLPDKLGGVFNYVDNLLRYRQPDQFRYAAVLTDNLADVDARSDGVLPADELIRFSHLPAENLRCVLKRLAAAVPKAPGVLVINDWLPLAMCSVYDTGHMVVNISHADSDYYYGLAKMHEPVIDCFVAYTEYIRDRLLELLPHRQSSIFLLPYGVLPPERARQAKPGPLRLLYVGRLSRGKGIFDLPLIDANLSEVDLRWTIQGTGPEEVTLKRAWPSHRVRWLGRQAMADVLQLYQDHDVLVMPSRSEGLPVALLEAASAGVVPVVSDLPTGIPEVVEHGLNGYRPAAGDVDGFARAIAHLAGHREELEHMSARLRQSTVRKFDIRTRAPAYQELYARWRELRLPGARRGQLHYGSRLDQPWMPNALVQLLRATRLRLAPRR